MCDINVTVLMSTYNGERYLRQQLDSIYSQQGVNITVVVRDDGSKDETISILTEYQKKHSLILERGKNIGVGNSFMELLYKAPNSEFYALSDQDDIWLPYKLLKAVKIIKLQNEDAPYLYVSNQIVANEKGEKIKMRFNKVPRQDLIDGICSNKLSGCTMVFNSQLADYIIPIKYRPSKEFLQIRIHDVWLFLVAKIIGRIIYDDNSYILYRQHNDNVVGIQDETKITQVKNNVKKLLNHNIKNGRSRTALELLKCYKFELCMEDYQNLTKIATYQNNITSRVSLATDKKLKIYRNEKSYILFFIKTLLKFI